MFNPITYSYLQFDTVDYAPEPETSETEYRWSSSSLNGISQNKTLCEAEQHRIYKCFYRYSARKSKTELVDYLLILLLIERHVSGYSEAIIRFNKC